MTLAASYLTLAPGATKKVVPVTQEEQRRASQYLALWIATSIRPLSIVEDDGLTFYVRSITEKLGGISLKIPGRTQVRLDIADLAIELPTMQLDSRVFCLRLVRDGASNGVLAALIKRRQKPRREANTEVTSVSQPESRNPLLSKAPGETASVGVVNVACETAPADNGTYTEAEPWEQDRAAQELADFLREWQVMEQLKQQIDNTTSRNVS
ncbi:hypothetical protein PI126_g22130 [Phytophthora idaei]|nr:hypothetical protein PI126_g22130 [Phytophthora idaei]